MTIYRAEHKKNYTVVNNFICKDNRLSWKAKGIWLYAFSRPDDWEFNLSDLLNQATDGKDSVYAGLKELEKYGYLLREQTRQEGKFSKADWVFHETPQEVKKCLPQPENPHTENPHTENPPLLSTKELSTEKKQQQQPPVVCSVAASFCKELQDIDIPLEQKVKLSKDFSREDVKHGLLWIKQNKNPLKNGLVAALRWACTNKPEIPREKPVEKAPIDLEPLNRTYYREINATAHKNNVRLHEQGLREATSQYLESENYKIYYKDRAFLEQITNYLRKKSIECHNIFNVIKTCQKDLEKQLV